MKAFNGFKSEASTGRIKQLPVGAYVAKIKKVFIDGQEPDQYIRLRVDVCEGPYANFFFNRFMQDKENSNYEPKYKGDYKIRIPNDNNPKAMYPESDLKRFNDMIYRIEQSNDGYHWDWDEKGLEGLLVGINMVESEYNGFRFTKIGRTEIAQDVRAGKVAPIQPKAPKGDADDSTFIDPQSGFVGVEVDSLPF